MVIKNRSTKNWTWPENLRTQLEKKWHSQQLLKDWFSGALVFPLKFSLQRPGARELIDKFVEARHWIEAWDDVVLANAVVGEESDPAICLETEVLNNRGIGRQSIPRYLVFNHETALFSWLGQQQPFDTYRQLVSRLCQHWPQLAEMPGRTTLARAPFRLLALAPQQEALLAVLEWFAANPRSGLYLRQLDIAGVHTKFIEQNKTLIDELLGVILPAGHSNTTDENTGKKGFEQKYGLQSDPVQIRFRLLDPALTPALSSQMLSDLSIPLADFAQLDLPVQRVFITENKINGLAFPPQERALVVFGLGYGVDALQQVPWLHEKTLYYWGDIDTHGFRILAQLRRHFPALQSFLMDESTFLNNQNLWVEETQQSPLFDLNLLDANEARLVNALWQQRWGERLRLEQERIGFNQVCRALQNLDIENAREPR